MRRLRGHFGISAPRVAVRAHMPWYWRVLVAIALLSVSFAVAGWIYDAGRRIAGFDQRETQQELSMLREKAGGLEAEAARLRALADSADSSLQIERTTQEQLVRQVKALEQENGHLKEEIAFFENLAAAVDKEPGFSINRLRIEPDAFPGQYRFRMLVAAQGGRKDREFKGNLQLLVSLQQDDKDDIIIYPTMNDPNRQRYSINFKHFQRVDGTFKVPAAARITSVEVRLMQEGAVRTSQIVTP